MFYWNTVIIIAALENVDKGVALMLHQDKLQIQNTIIVK